MREVTQNSEESKILNKIKSKIFQQLVLRVCYIIVLRQLKGDQYGPTLEKHTWKKNNRKAFTSGH